MIDQRAVKILDQVIGFSLPGLGFILILAPLSSGIYRQFCPRQAGESLKELNAVSRYQELIIIYPMTPSRKPATAPNAGNQCLLSLACGATS